MASEEVAVPAGLPPIRRLRVCLLGGTPDGCSFQPGIGKLDIASSFLRGLTSDRPSEADPILDLAYDHGVFERAWWELLSLKEVLENSPVIDRWGIGPLSVWDVEGRLRYDRRADGEATPPFDHDPFEECASLCPGSASKLHFGHKRSTGEVRHFRDCLMAAGQDIAALEGIQQELAKVAKEKPRELVRKVKPCPGVLASFARYAPEVGDLAGCGTVFLHVFELESRPLGCQRNVAMVYAAAPNSWTHRGQLPGTFLLALSALGSNIMRCVREYNRLAGSKPLPEAWERAMWWQTDLRSQVEYYFCDKSLRIERYFREKIVGQEDGWIDVELVKGFPRMAFAGVSVNEELLDAMKDSKCVDTKVGEEGKAFIRRSGGKPLPDLGEPRKRRFGGGEVPWGKRRSSTSDDPTCWDFVRRGVCPRGDKCRYLHSNPNAEAAAGEGGGAPPAAEASAEGTPQGAAAAASPTEAAAAAAAAAVGAEVPAPVPAEGGAAGGVVQAAQALGEQLREAGLMPDAAAAAGNGAAAPVAAA